MNSSIFEQRSRFAMIGALMVIISLMFLFYMGSSSPSMADCALRRYVTSQWESYPRVLYP